MEIKDLNHLIDRTIEELQNFKHTPLDEDRSKQLISDLSNLQAFLISLHIIKISVLPQESGKKAIQLFHNTHLFVLEYYLRELYALGQGICENDMNKPYLSSIAPIRISTEALSEDMQKHKMNKLRYISKNTLEKLMNDISGMSFSQEDLEYFASSLAGSFISSLLYSAMQSNESHCARNLLYSLVYRTFQVVNAFAEQKIFDGKITFEEKKLGES